MTHFFSHKFDGNVYGINRDEESDAEMDFAIETSVEKYLEKCFDFIQDSTRC